MAKKFFSLKFDILNINTIVKHAGYRRVFRRDPKHCCNFKCNFGRLFLSKLSFDLT